MTHGQPEQDRADLAAFRAGMPEFKAAIDREVLARLTEASFGDRFTVFPDTGITELHCYRCEPGCGKEPWRTRPKAADTRDRSSRPPGRLGAELARDGDPPAKRRRCPGGARGPVAAGGERCPRKRKPSDPRSNRRLTITSSP